jgi:hypothetical protein
LNENKIIAFDDSPNQADHILCRDLAAALSPLMVGTLIEAVIDHFSTLQLNLKFSSERSNNNFLFIVVLFIVIPALTHPTAPKIRHF